MWITFFPDKSMKSSFFEAFTNRELHAFNIQSKQ